MELNPNCGAGVTGASLTVANAYIADVTVNGHPETKGRGPLPAGSRGPRAAARVLAGGIVAAQDLGLRRVRTDRFVVCRAFLARGQKIQLQLLDTHQGSGEYHAAFAGVFVHFLQACIQRLQLA